MASIVGGTYWEFCRDPHYDELWGSGLRAACALSGNGFDIDFYSGIASKDLPVAHITCNAFQINSHFFNIPETVSWEYSHPLSKPECFPKGLDRSSTILPELKAHSVLYYGMAEAVANITADYLVYDPQNGVPFDQCGAKGNHVAIVLNKKEAYLLSGYPDEEDISSVGRDLRLWTGAEVIVIKDGPQGGIVISSEGAARFPIHATKVIWPIGSGDVFSASFFWKWAIEKLSPIDAAKQASVLTAYYCETQSFPLPVTLPDFAAIDIKPRRNNVYLAGPFFNTAERWLIEELRNALIDFGNQVFSPLHDAGLVDPSNVMGSSQLIAAKDLDAINKADVVLAVVDSTDAGTLFEIGYAVAKGKRVIALAENIETADFTMLVGTGCTLCKDLTTAVYKASW